MIIVYTPAGGEPEHYDARTLRTSEASIVARTVDMKWNEIKEGLGDGDLDAMRGVVWVLKKRANPSLRFGEFDPGVDEMVSRFDQREVVDYVTRMADIAAKDPDITREQLVDALANVPDGAADRAHAEAVVKEMLEGPKGPDPASEQDGPEAAAASLTSTSGEPSI